MTTQYNVPVKVIDSSKEYMLQGTLRGYDSFVDSFGNLNGTVFSRERVPYVGEILVVKTIRKDAADLAYEVLREIEGLMVMPINECLLEED